MTPHIKGRMIEAGTPACADGETPTPHMIIETTREQLMGNRNILYRDVVVMLADDFAALVSGEPMRWDYSCRYVDSSREVGGHVMIMPNGDDEHDAAIAEIEAREDMREKLTPYERTGLGAVKVWKNTERTGTESGAANGSEAAK